jgi:hypothetical protein
MGGRREVQLHEDALIGARSHGLKFVPSPATNPLLTPPEKQSRMRSGPFPWVFTPDYSQELGPGPVVTDSHRIRHALPESDFRDVVRCLKSANQTHIAVEAGECLSRSIHTTECPPSWQDHISPGEYNRIPRSFSPQQ